MSESYKGQRPIYLGGSHVDDITTCLKVSDGNISSIRLLKCDHREADDHIMFHVNHGVIFDQHQNFIIALADTDVFICLMYNVCSWNEFDIKELWVICGQGASTRVVLIHCLWSFHVKFHTRLQFWHLPSQILLKLAYLLGIYENNILWKFQVHISVLSKTMTTWKTGQFRAWPVQNFLPVSTFSRHRIWNILVNDPKTGTWGISTMYSPKITTKSLWK